MNHYATILVFSDNELIDSFIDIPIESIVMRTDNDRRINFWQGFIYSSDIGLDLRRLLVVTAESHINNKDIPTIFIYNI